MSLTSEISFRATWKSKLRHPAFVANDQVSEPVETELFIDTVYGDAVEMIGVNTSEPAPPIFQVEMNKKM